MGVEAILRGLRWLSQDPLEEAGGLNLTAFCNGDPVNKWDPLGLDAFIVIHGITGQSKEWYDDFMKRLEKAWVGLDWQGVKNADDRKNFVPFGVTWNIKGQDDVPDSAVASLFHDLSEEGLKKNRGILAGVFDKAFAYAKKHPNEQVHLISHSQGTVISLDALQLLEKRRGDVDLLASLVTMGSPLGVERDNILKKRIGKLPESLQQADLDLACVQGGGWLNVYNPGDVVNLLNCTARHASILGFGSLSKRFSASGVPVQNIAAEGTAGQPGGPIAPHYVYWHRTRALATWMQTHNRQATIDALMTYPEEQRIIRKKMGRRAWADSLYESILRRLMR